MRILLVEDDPMIGKTLQQALQQDGYAVDWVTDGESGRTAITTSQDAYVLVLLDLGLPRKGGLALLRELRREGNRVRVLVVTARDAVADRVEGLDAGADDYLTKPFRLTELMARLRAHLRRRPDPQERTCIEVGRLRLDLLARRAYLGPAELALRPKEFDLLAVLTASAGNVLTRNELMADVWDENWFGSTKTLDVHVSSLRRKLMLHGEPAERISTVRGRGYRFEVEPAG
jgi:DNA-binding response OmpR family regulator